MASVNTTPLTLQKRRGSAMSKRRSISGPAQGSSTTKNLRRLSLQFSSSVSSLISFTSQSGSQDQTTTSIAQQPPAKVPLAVDYRLCSIVVIDGLDVYIPQYTEKCCHFIISHGIVEGIFRMNGSIRNISSVERKLLNDTLPAHWRFVLLKDNQQLDSPDSILVTPHDVATLLKRWISRIDGGVITKTVGNQINNQFSNIRGHFSNLDGEVEKATTPTDTPITINNPMFETPTQNNINLDDDDYLKTPTDAKYNDFHVSSNDNDQNNNKNNNDNDNDNDNSNNNNNNSANEIIEVPVRASSRIPDLYVDQLNKLPIQNLHLLIYLLSIFNKLNDKEVIKKTRMDSSNIAKMMQLSIFNTDSLVKEPKDNFGSMESFSELKSFYDNFEKVLTNWIEFYDHLIDQLKPIIISKNGEMNEFLNSKQDNHHHQKLEIVKKMKSEESLASILSYNDDFPISIPKVVQQPPAIKVTTVFNGESNNDLPLVTSDDDDDDNASIVYTPIDKKIKINGDVPKTNGTSSENVDPTIQESTLIPSSSPKKLRDNIGANKPKQGLGLKFRGLFKKKVTPEMVSTKADQHVHHGEIHINKRNETKSTEAKKEKRKSSFQFLTRS